MHRLVITIALSFASLSSKPLGIQSNSHLFEGRELRIETSKHRVFHRSFLAGRQDSIRLR